MKHWWPRVVVLLVVIAACGGAGAVDEPVASPSSTVSTPGTAGDSSTTTAGRVGLVDGCAHVVAATITPTTEGFTVTATVSSAERGWEKYADLWEVRTVDGVVLGERVLAHPHENEQPFTRSLSGVVIPDGVDSVEIAARDSVEGFCGNTLTIEVIR